MNVLWLQREQERGESPDSRGESRGEEGQEMVGGGKKIPPAPPHGSDPTQKVPTLHLGLPTSREGPKIPPPPRITIDLRVAEIASFPSDIRLPAPGLEVPGALWVELRVEGLW